MLLFLYYFYGESYGNTKLFVQMMIIKYIITKNFQNQNLIKFIIKLKNGVSILGEFPWIFLVYGQNCDYQPRSRNT